MWVGFWRLSAEQRLPLKEHNGRRSGFFIDGDISLNIINLELANKGFCVLHFFKQNYHSLEKPYQQSFFEIFYYEEIGHCNYSCCQGVNARIFIFLQKVTNAYLSFMNIIIIN